jgi:hypothetical protein
MWYYQRWMAFRYSANGPGGALNHAIFVVKEEMEKVSETFWVIADPIGNMQAIGL